MLLLLNIIKLVLAIFKDNLLTANQSLSLSNSKETVLHRLIKPLPQPKMFASSANKIKFSGTITNIINTYNK